MNRDGSMYTSGNTGCNIPGGTVDWCVGFEWQQYLLSETKRAVTPFPTTGVAVVTSPLPTKADALKIVLNGGPTIPVRDRIDAELVTCFEQGTNCTQDGAVPFSSGWPVYSQDGDLPVDSDNDGMVDAWGLAHQGDLSLTPSGVELDE